MNPSDGVLPESDALRLLGLMAQSAGGDDSRVDPGWEMPLAVTLDRASAVLGLPREDGQRRAKAGTYPVELVSLGPEGYRVATARLVRHAGLARVAQEVLRDQQS